MIFIGEEPCDDGVAQSLVVKALQHAEKLEWKSTIQHLESAAIIASARLGPAIIETLVTFYIKENAYAKIARVFQAADAISPALAIGGILAERSRRVGLSLPELPKDFYPATLEALCRFHAENRYNSTTLLVIQPLLVQLGEVDLAIALLRRLLAEAASEISEEMIVATLSLALEEKRRDEALEIVSAVRSLPQIGPERVLRYQVLLGAASLEEVPPGSDKVIAFLRRAQHGGKHEAEA